MRLRRRSTIVLALAALALVAAGKPAKAPDGSPAAVVRAFYRFHFAHDMAFTEASVKKKQKWIDADLYAKLLAELHRPESPDEAPNIDGDPFTDSQEYPKSFSVGAESGEGEERQVALQLRWPHEKRDLTIVLVRTDGSWRIRDVRYPDGGTLRDLLPKD